MCLPKDVINFKIELLCQPYREDRLRLAERERLLRSIDSKRSWTMKFSCSICKMLFYGLVSPLYHHLKHRIEAQPA